MNSTFLKSSASFVLLLALGSTVGCSSAAQNEGDETTGAVVSDSERQSIEDVLKAAVVADLQQDVKLEIATFHALRDWTYISGRPTQPNGQPIDYSKTKHAPAVQAEAFDDGVIALLRKQDGAWKVVEFEIGSTDAPQSSWAERFGSPPQLIVNVDPDLKPGMPARKAMLDTLRAPIEAELHQKVIFKINFLKDKQGWAFLSAQPLQPNGNPIDYRGTRYQKLIDEFAFDDHVDALLYFDQNDWTTKTWELGSTDVSWEPWGNQFGSPAGIFPGGK
jgi:hypothetical protein